MEAPAPSAGLVEKLLIKIGDRVSEGTPILLLKGGDGAMQQPPSLVEQQEPEPSELPKEPVAAPAAAQPPPATAGAPPISASAARAGADFSGVHASPAVRRLARELGVDLTRLKGTGEKGRITKEDVKAFLSGPAPAAAAAAPAGGMGIPEIPAQDFSKFGAI